MVLSHARRFIFFHNPKCAGMALREALDPFHDDAVRFWGIHPVPYFRNRLDLGHLRLWELQALYPSAFAAAARYTSVVVVRSPFERFLSAVNEHMKKFQPQIALGGMAAEERVAVVERFVQQALDIGRITTDWRFVHFSPQLWFITLGGRVVPRHLVPMDPAGGFTATVLERLGVPGLAVGRVNPSPVDLRAALASPVVDRFIRGFYADDLAFLAADPALAGLVGR